jgi:hypothetical protein
MNREKEARALRVRAARIARDILNQNVGIIEGVRRLKATIVFLPEYEEEKQLFLSVVSVESQTDDVPLGLARESVPEAQLKEIDESMKTFLPLIRESLFEACRKIIERYESSG